ncbi:MAG: hypothetical protein WDA03_09800 [Trueperaceae bacterium]
MNPRLLLVLLAAATLLAGCGLVGGDTPGTFDYSGDWRGTLNDEANGAGTLLVTLQQSGHALSGTWHAVMGADATRALGGSWTGQVFVGQDSDLLNGTLAPAVAGQCSYTLTLARANEQLSGTYVPVGAATDCTHLTRGSVQLSIQP